MKARNLVVDALALAVYLLAANPAITGFAVHEWLGLGLVVLVIAHVAGAVVWAGDLARAAVARRSGRGAALVVVDALIFVALVVCAASGLMVSGTVLPAFGLYATGYFFWSPLHAASAKVFLALLLVHVLLHVDRIAAGLRRLRGGKGSGKNC